MGKEAKPAVKATKSAKKEKRVQMDELSAQEHERIASHIVELTEKRGPGKSC